MKICEVGGEGLFLPLFGDAEQAERLGEGLTESFVRFQRRHHGVFMCFRNDEVSCGVGGASPLRFLCVSGLAFGSSRLPLPHRPLMDFYWRSPLDLRVRRAEKDGD